MIKFVCSMSALSRATITDAFASGSRLLHPQRLHGQVYFERRQTTEVKTKAGQCVWHNTESHAVENTGKTEVHVIEIELKR